MMLLDFASRQIEPSAIAAAGYDGVIAYVSQSRPGANFGAKPLTHGYADALRAAGLQVVSNYQFGKPNGTAPSDYTRGFDGGVADAHEALRIHEAAGGPDHAPIFFSVDEGIDLDTWNDVAVFWFRGINSVLGVDRTGVYGSSLVCAWAIEDGVIGRSTTSRHFWAWQTKAWSGGALEKSAVLFQRIVDTESNPGPVVGGIRVDVNDVLADDFGQWDYDRSRKVAAVPNPITREMLSNNCDDGPRSVDWLGIHTQQARSTADNLARYCNNPAPGGNPAAAVSYNAVLDDVETILVVPFDQNPWSAANANSRADHICCAGSFAEWSRGKWLETDDSDGVSEDAMMWRLAAVVAWRCIERDIPIEYVGGTGIYPPPRRGVCGHVDFGRWGGGHTDPGPDFPWDELIRRAQQIANQFLQEVLMSFADDELKKPFPSRSIYRDNDRPVDTVAGLVSNIDARQHESFVEQQALRGVPAYVDAVRRVARDGIVGDRTGFDYPGIVDDSRARAQAVLDIIEGAK
jgi:hypothetical protein